MENYSLQLTAARQTQPKIILLSFFSSTFNSKLFLLVQLNCILSAETEIEQALHNLTRNHAMGGEAIVTPVELDVLVKSQVFYAGIFSWIYCIEECPAF